MNDTGALTIPTIDGRSGAMPTVGLALGAGGARGFAHIPVIEALDELGVRPAAIAGSSMGAIIGAGMASGMTGAEIREYVLETIGKRSIVANRLWSLGPATMRDALGGFRLGQFNLHRILEAFLPDAIPADFADLGIPLKIVATDYYGQHEVVCEEGSLFDAIAASSALPALFMPVHLGGRVMIDGGIFNPVPYDHLNGMADIVIGVDVVGGPEGEASQSPNRIDSLFGASQLMMQSNIALKLKLGSPDIFLRPNVNAFRVLDFLKARQVIESTEGVKDVLKRELNARIENFLRR
ncbi:patatin-like phospholipase family protein [Rhizobium cremeum]|uniref:patatin-like phospholipase family protein n=1 Tax=Rhizobium cremeum TaxID=2813827 RepID=UPI001FD54809|nr:patatin-like phospholipase family protein [Rhizobium cremeum]MCJ7996956.1 patatin-like phospholipase family protein [Rhizobium cremeum]MCJ8002174.1 patatin-like phospholipase family protein [Rhizobium cremeum]